jgi:isopentenyl-diphosphate delta-isomerase type 1
MSQDMVVLVDDLDNELGIMSKTLVHTDKTPLHRAFSVFLFDESGKVLVTQRSLTKTTWPGIWSNSCCGHPKPGESYEAAIVRRVGQELGTAISNLEKVSDYRYRFERDGVVEHEICPVYRAVIAGVLRVDPQEVHDWKWMDWDEWMEVLKADKPGALGIWSEWCKEEAGLF